MGPLSHEAGLQLLALVRRGLSLLDSAKVSQTDCQEMVGVGKVGPQANCLSQQAQRLLMVARVDVGASELSIIDMVVRIARIAFQGFLENGYPLRGLANDV